MKLSKLDLDKKMSIAEMKQIKAGCVRSTTGNRTTASTIGLDTDVDEPRDYSW